MVSLTVLLFRMVINKGLYRTCPRLNQEDRGNACYGIPYSSTRCKSILKKKKSYLSDQKRYFNGKNFEFVAYIMVDKSSLLLSWDKG